MIANMKKIVAIRRMKKITQKELAKLTGLSLGAVQGYEQGRFNPSFSTLEKICNALGISVQSVVDGGELMLPDDQIHRDIHNLMFDSRQTFTPDLAARSQMEDNYIDFNGYMISKREYLDYVDELKAMSDYMGKRYVEYLKKKRDLKEATRETYYAPDA